MGRLARTRLRTCPHRSGGVRRVDLLYLDGELLLDRPYTSRRARLVELGVRASPWLTTPAADTVAEAGELWGLTRDLQLEGVVAKRLDASYLPGRRGPAWLKLKHPHARDVQMRPGAERWTASRRRPFLPAIAYD